MSQGSNERQHLPVGRLRMQPCKGQRHRGHLTPDPISRPLDRLRRHSAPSGSRPDGMNTLLRGMTAL